MVKFTALFNQYRGLRREIYTLAFGSMVTHLGSMVWPVMTMILSQKLGFSAADISYYFVITGLLALPASLLGGKLADRFNKKRIIVICDSISIIGFLVCAALPLGITSIIIYVISGIFQSMESPSYHALFADMSMTKDRERAFSLSYLGANLGLVLAPTIAGLLFKDHLWLCFLINGIAIAISTVLIAVLIRDITPVRDTGEEAEYQEKKDDTGVLRILKKNPMLILYLVCAALYSGVYAQYNFIMPLDMASVHGDSGAVIFGTVSSLNCIAVVIFTPLITKLFARMRDTGKMLTGRVLIFSGYVFFLLFIGYIPSYYMAMLIFTWGEIFSVLSEAPYVSTRIPASHRGRINGITSVFTAVVTGYIDLAVGHMYDRSGSTRTWILILTVALASIAATALLKRYDRKAYPKLYKA